MESVKTIKQNIGREYISSLEVAEKYYSILSVINDLKLTPREIQLFAFMGTKGSISSGGAKEQFIQHYGSSEATIDNMVCKLSKKGYIIKEKDKHKLHPALSTVNFQYTLSLSLTLSTPKDKEEQDEA